MRCAFVAKSIVLLFQEIVGSFSTPLKHITQYDLIIPMLLSRIPLLWCNILLLWPSLLWRTRCPHRPPGHSESLPTSLAHHLTKKLMYSNQKHAVHLYKIIIINEMAPPRWECSYSIYSWRLKGGFSPHGRTRRMIGDTEVGGARHYVTKTWSLVYFIFPQLLVFIITLALVFKMDGWLVSNYYSSYKSVGCNITNTDRHIFARL